MRRLENLDVVDLSLGFFALVFFGGLALALLCGVAALVKLTLMFLLS